MSCYRAGCVTCGLCCDVATIPEAEAWETAHVEKHPDHETVSEGYPYSPVFTNVAP